MNRLAEEVRSVNSDLIGKISQTLQDGDRRRLPLWIEKSLGVPLDSISASVLEGMKVALEYVSWKVGTIEEEPPGVIDRSKSLVYGRQVVMKMKSRDVEEEDE
jgi:hypothetical protein